MSESKPLPTLDAGIAVIHSNQLERLRDVVEYWLTQHPLAPLENEIFLVQSNGMGQWLKQSLAHNAALGIAAAMQTVLPALFVWSVYRAVLGAEIPKEQPLAKAPLTWRLYRLLPTLAEQPAFATLAHFLADDRQGRKRYQLAEQLADLFDQYQVYRSDWLADWADGRDVLRNAHGDGLAMPEAQVWQAVLWRVILADLGADAAAFASRAAVHAAFMRRIDGLVERPAGLPRRVMLFGLSSLPQQALEVLAKLGRFCQIVLFVANPCRHYWADIIEDQELLKAERRRHAYKPGMTAALTAEDLHLNAPPLLAAWGKQGRDYIRLLDHFDETRHYAGWQWPDNKIDLFQDYGEPAGRTLLQQLQQSILDLESLPAEPLLLRHSDDSIAFHVAHSPQREVEILHDQLLARFAAAQSTDQPLKPRDVIVMVPDINRYAPHIRAVFGLIEPDDPRYIPYSLADQQQRGQNPLLVAVEALLALPESRFAVSELLGLLEVPALRTRFAIDEAAVPTLHRWIEQSGIRWGLNAQQRTDAVAMPVALEANTWRFGLRRMWLGYAVGTGEPFAGIEPYEEVGGLDAQWLGGLSFLIETLEKYAGLLKHPQSVQQWQATLTALLDDFFSAGNDRERSTLETLVAALAQWSRHCEQAGLTAVDALPMTVVREAWLAGVDEPSLHQRFLTGRVNFCTLMPMRAIPFRVICLLGMNDGDYPRNQATPGFDLMSRRGQYRPGDRSRRQDDQYLFLEALLSARQQLYVGWVGRSIRDNSARPPSVLVSQLRDTLDKGWALAGDQSLLTALTVEHPLQPFSADYVAANRDPRLFTYAREWFEGATPLHGVATADSTAVPFAPSLSKHPRPDSMSTTRGDPTLPEPQPEVARYALSLESLARFLKAPVQAFCNQTLKFGFDDETAISADCEPFGFNKLEAYGYSDALLQGLKQTRPDDTAAFFAREQTAMAQRGQLPLGGFAEAGFDALAAPAHAAWQRYQALLSDWPQALDAHVLQLPPFVLHDGASYQLTGNLSQLRRNPHDIGLLFLTAQTVSKDDNIAYHKLLRYWLQHLAACADFQPLPTWVVAADSLLVMQPIESGAARRQLSMLIAAYHAGMTAPLPVAAKTAFAWLSAPPAQADAKAVACYEGSEWRGGEVDYDRYLQRFFPSFAELNADDYHPGFKDWAETLYRPVIDAIHPQQT